MMMNVVAIAAMLVAVTVEALPGMGMGMGMFPRMMPMKGMGMGMGMGHGPHVHDEIPGKILTCQLNFRDVNDPSVVVNSISINIKERPESGGGLGHRMPMPGMGHMGMNMMNHGNDKPGLSASIGIFSSTGGKVTVAITETARPQDGCNADSFGRFLKSRNDHDHIPAKGMGMMGKGMGMGMMGKFGMGGMGMMGKYGMGGMGMKYGMGGMPGFGMTSVKSHTRTPFGSSGMMKSSSGFGMGGGMGLSPMMMGMGMRNPMMMGMMGGHPHSHEDEPAGGVVTTDVAPGIKASIVIDRLKGFESLDELAGRGVVVCPADNVEHDFDDTSMCEGGILSCCALHYDTAEVVLGGVPAALPGSTVNYGSNYVASSVPNYGPVPAKNYGAAAPPPYSAPSAPKYSPPQPSAPSGYNPPPPSPAQPRSPAYPAQAQPQPSNPAYPRQG